MDPDLWLLIPDLLAIIPAVAVALLAGVSIFFLGLLPNSSEHPSLKDRVEYFSAVTFENHPKLQELFNWRVGTVVVLITMYLIGYTINWSTFFPGLRPPQATPNIPKVTDGAEIVYKSSFEPSLLTPTPTNTNTPTLTNTPTDTSTPRPTPTATYTPSHTPTYTLTPTTTPTPILLPTPTLLPTPILLPTPTPTPLPTVTNTPVPTSSPTSTVTPPKYPTGCEPDRRIEYPGDGSKIDKARLPKDTQGATRLAIDGIVNTSDFHRFKLEYASGESKASDDIYRTHLIIERFERVNGGGLYSWDVTTLPPGWYTLRLVVVQGDRANYFEPPCIIGFELQ